MFTGSSSKYGATPDRNNQEEAGRSSSYRRSGSPTPGSQFRPDAGKKLENEFEAARSMLHSTHKSLLKQQEDLNNEMSRNSALRSQSRGASPTINRFQPNLVDENVELENRLRELEGELRLQRTQTSAFSPRITMLEQRFVESDAQNFLKNNQNTELLHLQKMMNIFEEENQRLRSLYDNNLKPSQADVELIKSNIQQVRLEIDEILMARAQMNQKYKDLVNHVENLSKENDSLRLIPSKRTDSVQVNDLIDQLNTRNIRIVELNSELNQLRERLNTQSAPSPNNNEVYGLRREIETKNSQLREFENMITLQSQNQITLSQNNQVLSSQLYQLKEQLDKIDTMKIKREMDLTNSRIQGLEDENEELRRDLARAKSNNLPTNRGRDDQSTIKKLEDENRHLKRQVDRLSDQKRQGEEEELSFRNQDPEDYRGKDSKYSPKHSTGITPTRNVTTLKKKGMDDIDDFLLADRNIMGEVSYEEMMKLEGRIKEFGDCNVELEDLIYRLKAKMAGTEYNSAHFYESGDSSSAIDNKRFSNKDAESFRKILRDLRNQVDRLTSANEHRVQHQVQVGIPDVVTQLELIMQNNRKNTEVEIKYHMMMKNYQDITDSLTELKDRYRQMEIKYNTLVSVNIQNETHIEKLIGQIQDNKEYFKKLIGENEGLKLRERDAAQELSDYFKRNTLMQEMNDDLTRKSASV